MVLGSDTSEWSDMVHDATRQVKVRQSSRMRPSPSRDHRIFNDVLDDVGGRVTFLSLSNQIATLPLPSVAPLDPCRHSSDLRVKTVYR